MNVMKNTGVHLFLRNHLSNHPFTQIFFLEENAHCNSPAIVRRTPNTCYTRTGVLSPFRYSGGGQITFGALRAKTSVVCLAEYLQEQEFH